MKLTEELLDKPESLKLCRDPQPNRPRSIRLDPKPVAVTYGWYMDDNIRYSQPQRQDMQFHRIRAWERVKEQSRMQKYHDISKLKQMTQQQVNEGLTVAIKDMNNWLYKGETGEHPNNVFVNFFKKSFQKTLGSMQLLDSENRRGVKGNNVLVHIEDKYVRDIHFYDTGWPSWGMDFVGKLRIAAAAMDYKALAGKRDNVVTNVAQSGFESKIDGLIDGIASFKFS